MGHKTSCLCLPQENVVQMLIPNSIPFLTSTLPGYLSVALLGAYWEMQAHFSTSLSKTMKRKTNQLESPPFHTAQLCR